jgi:hypothetical protein
MCARERQSDCLTRESGFETGVELCVAKAELSRARADFQRYGAGRRNYFHGDKVAVST